MRMLRQPYRTLLRHLPANAHQPPHVHPRPPTAPYSDCTRSLFRLPAVISLPSALPASLPLPPPPPPPPSPPLLPLPSPSLQPSLCGNSYRGSHLFLRVNQTNPAVSFPPRSINAWHSSSYRCLDTADTARHKRSCSQQIYVDTIILMSTSMQTLMLTSEPFPSTLACTEQGLRVQSLLTLYSRNGAFFSLSPLYTLYTHCLVDGDLFFCCFVFFFALLSGAFRPSLLFQHPTHPQPSR